MSAAARPPLDHLVAGLREQADHLGFDALAIGPASLPASVQARYEAFLAAGRHGTMTWLADSAPRRRAPRAMWPQANSAIMLAMSYTPTYNPLEDLDKTDTACMSVYAQGRDYHQVVKGKLKHLAGWLQRRVGHDVKVFVDTAPLLEKPLAAQAGLGWQGKHTNLLSREIGNWFFIGTILTSIDLPFDRPAEDRCGSCRRCLDICPTNAFPAPYQLDARRCISYLTIEHHGPIAPELCASMGNRIYGCDDCLAICPWNKFARLARETKLVARSDLRERPLAELIDLDDAGFRALFAGTAIKRIGLARFRRNVAIAIGNSGQVRLCAKVQAFCDDPDAGVRAAARWASTRLAGRQP